MKKMMMSLKSSRMILHIGEKPIFCVGISSASWAGGEVGGGGGV